MTTTPTNTKAEIIADLWTKYRYEPQFEKFVEYNDIGIPLAFCLANDIVAPTPKSDMFIDETFALLLDQMELEDTGFDSIYDIIPLDNI